jgi:hypothetical protein
MLVSDVTGDLPKIIGNDERLYEDELTLYFRTLFFRSLKLWGAPIPMVRITAPQITAIQKLPCCGWAAASEGGINEAPLLCVNLGARVNRALSGRSFGRRGRANLYFAAILEIDGRGEHDLVALLDAVAELNLGS